MRRIWTATAPWSASTVSSNEGQMLKAIIARWRAYMQRLRDEEEEFLYWRDPKTGQK